MDMLNAYGATHGSVIYAPADVAFAATCNSGGVKSLALAMNVNCLRRAHEGEVLTAEEYEESAGKTTAVRRIEVTNGEGKLVAVAAGLAYRQG
ncbi:MAG: hotdog fold thioesterase [Candidatus Methanosuratus sp.]|nr:hotdog fold thioesterase [Candidatus Methanosuratincola sp.]